MSPLERARLKAGEVAEVILFRRNITDRPQLCRLIADLRGYGVTVGIDHEGGRVHRFPGDFSGITLFPPASEWMRGRHSTVRAIAARMADELAALGFSHWYAPVADRFSPLATTDVIGDRSFARDPARLAEAVAGFVEGSQGYGLTRCLKHFPGHGHLTVDSHHGLPYSYRSLSYWQRYDLPAFIAGARAGAERVMVAHLSWPSAGIGRSWLDPTMIPRLRASLGSKITVISDDLAMGAVGSTNPWRLQPELAKRGFQGIMWCAPEATSAASTFS